MSDAHVQAHGAPHDAAYEGPHEGPIKTPKQLIWTVIASFLVPILIIILLTNFVAFGSKEGAGADAMSAEAVATRIMPIGHLELKEAGSGVAKTGEQVFQAQCSACHATGAAGAPKFGDEAAWGPRVKTGFDALLHSALAGKGAMGPQGGGDFSDYEVARAVVYMANHGGGKLDEPKPPADAASGAAGAASGAAAPAAAAAPASTAASQ